MLNKHKIEYYLFIFAGNLLSIFGFSSIRYSSQILAFIFFRILRIRRKVVITNLSKAFPELNPQAIKQLAQKNYRSAAISFLEIFNFKNFVKEEIHSLILPEGIEVVKSKLDEGKGLILLTAHIGNWELGAIAAGVYLNESIKVLIKKQKNPYVKNWLKDTRERFGNKQISVGIKSARELITVIRNNEMVGIVGDQRGPRTEGLRVEFFGQQTSTFIGTASIAIKTKCPVVVIFCIRQPNFKYKFVIEELNYKTELSNKEELIKSFNQMYMKKLESIIRKYPDQWLWMHDIWKY